MEHNFKRLLSLVIALVMIVGMIPGAAFSVFAADSVVTTEAELATALAAGGTVTLGGDIEVTDTITVPAGVTATLDLAGHTISQQKVCTAHYTMINNKGTLTVTGNGKISLTDTGAGDPTYGWGSYTLSNQGTLVVENGTIENLSQQNVGDVKHMYCAIQQGSGAVSTTINGGTISTPTYRSVRTNAGALIINGGTFVGQVWLQPNQGDTTLEITGGSFAPAGVDGSSVFMSNADEKYTVTSASISGGYFATKIGCSDATALAGCITGGSCSASAVANTNPALLNEAYTAVENDDGSYSIVSNRPALPTATVTELDNADLTFALKFVADEATEESAFYADWLADFELTFNKDVTMNANGGADGYLSGQYDGWSENWVNVPFEDTPLKAGETLKIMEYAAKMMGQPGLELTYADVYTNVQEFNCGVLLTEEYLAANPDLEITLELRIYNPDNKEESYVIGQTYTFTPDEEVELPTATVTKLDNKDLTFALNFLADEPTAKQLEKYGKWYADFVLTTNKDVTFNANGGADGYLSGQYDAWSENWVNVPFENVTVKANEPLKIMAYAAEMMGQPGLKVTYNDIVTSVKDFDCGVYLDDLFVCNNTDLEITLELRMFNEDETESYVIGDTYTYSIPALPTATTKEVENENLTFAMNFVADEVTEEQLDFYGDWYADFELTVNKDITLNANGGADGYLSGQYDAWSENWVNVPFENVSLNANEPLKIMAYAAELMGKPGLKYTYREVYEVVKDFDCGMFLEPEFIAANPDVEITLELKMYNPKNEENHSHVIGETYVFKFDYVAYNTVTETFYDRVDDALLAAKDGETVILLKDTGANDGRTYAQLTVKEGVVFDVNGYTVTTDYMSCFGNTVDYSEANTGAVAVEPKHLLIQTDNEQVTVKTAKGFQFFEVEFVVDQVDAANNRYMFVPMLEAAAHELLAPGVATTGVTIKVDVSWKTADGHTRNQEFLYSDELVNGFIASYDPATDWYGQMFTLTLKDTTGISDLTFQAYVVSDTGVKYPA